MALVARLNIPSGDRRGLRALLAMPDADMARFIEAVKVAQPILDARDFAARVAANTSLAQDVDAADLVRVLLVLYTVRADTGFADAEFIDLLRDALVRGEEFEDLQLDTQWDSYAARLKTLLEIDHALEVVAKATALLNDHQRVFHSSRVYTDLRPVFSGEPSLAPSAGVIVHQLKLSYHEGDELKEFFVALDNVELRSLLMVLQRAEAKANGLKALMESASFRVLERES